MNNDEDMSSIPLNLCIKKPEKVSESSNANSNHEKTHTKVNVPQVNSTINSCHYSLINQSKKRGRKPKSILASSNPTIAHSSPFIDIKPRKRGRPPTLSPPPSHSSHLQQTALSIANKLHFSSLSGAFQNQYPFALLNTPLQPGWPTLSSTGQLIFPDKINGNQSFVDDKKNKIRENKVDSSVSGNSDINESIDSYSESNNEDDDSQSDSYSQSSEIRFSDKKLQDEIRLPHKYGWRRQTKIRSFSGSGVDGEVVYFTPCGKKLKSIIEVDKYLSKHGIKDLKKENFSFNSKIIVGEYLKPGEGLSELMLNEVEVNARINELKRLSKNNAFKNEYEKVNLKHKNLALEKDNHLKNLMERTRQIFPRDAKRLKLDEIKRIKDQEFIMKEHEKAEKMEMIRLEKIARAHQIEESRRKRREELERQRQEELIRKAQEKELKRQQAEFLREQEMQKRRELLIMADLERERRRQHMILVRSLEAHKKQEERERKKEEILAERRAIQEKKIQKKKLEMEMLKELKKPVEDMLLKDHKPIPTLNRIPGLKLPGKAFSHILMVFEFLHNFGETLGFDMDSLPSLNTLQLAMLNLDESAEDELLSIVHHLLVCAIEDPGIPSNVVTVLGQKLKDAPITNYNITEILRLYFYAFDCSIRDDIKEQRIEHRMVKVLSKAHPFISLNATDKSEILAFLCNELLCNQAIVKKIDENNETVANLRKDKWIFETELRKWKAIKTKREKKNEQEENKKNELEEGEEESGESDEDNPNNNSSNNQVALDIEEPDFTNEEIDKKIDKLNKQFNQANNKLNKATNTFRITSLGQDRYRRRYWVLPNAGGVFVEGLESGEPEEAENNIWTDDDLKNQSQEEMEQDQVEEEQSSVSVDNDNEKKIESQNEEEKEDKSQNEKQDNENDINTKSENVLKEEKDKQDEEMEIYKKDNEKDSEFKANNDSDVKEQDEIKKNDERNDESKATNKESSWMSPLFASMLSGSMFGNNTANSNNGMNSQLPFPFPLGLDLPGTSKTNKSQKPWFSILPRTPCDENTITEVSSKPSINPTLLFETLIKSKKSEKNEIANSLFSKSQKSDDQSSLVSSLMNGLPSNLFMQAFLYPHILNSLFNQQGMSVGGPCPPDASPLSIGNLNDISSGSIKNEKSDQEQTANQSTNQSTNQSANQSADISFQSVDLDICPSIQKRIAQQKEQQYENPQKIPLEYQSGWWRITDPSQLKALIEVLHSRGVREKQLQKHLQKYLTYATQSCKSNAVELEISELDRSISENCAFGAPKEDKCPHKKCQQLKWCKKVALRYDIAVLEQIEVLEEKIATSSMQMRNWKPSSRVSCDDKIKFSPAAIFVMQNPLDQDNDSKEINQDKIDDNLVNETNSVKSKKNKKSESGDVNPVAVGKERLLALEAVIERRYLKPPLGFKSNTILISVNSDSGQIDDYDSAADENATIGLLRWREAVREAQSSAEIALCLHFLESCIAWDKSIMRASCQFCGSGENEAQLLLCDGCDKGYHTYCFKPKMESIPDGDWFCFECQNKNTIDKVCIVCGKKGKLLNCDSCPKVFHPNCLDPPMTKPLKGKWTCYMCARKPKKFSQQKAAKKFSTPTSDDKQKDTSNANSSSTSLKESGKKSTNNSSKNEKETKKERKQKEPKETKEKNDFSICLKIISEMEKHEDAWPFLLPVNTKQFPTYKKIIKKPMDTNTIKSKIENGLYKNKDEFVSDVRLIFNNCETFNEDESPVGQAGHNLRAFFESKWKEHNGK